MLRYLDERHASSAFGTDLRALIESLSEMRRLVDEQFDILHHILTSHERGETNPKAQAREIDKEINALQAKLDEGVHHLLVRHSPLLEELRFVLALPKVAGQFERMGDHCKNSIKRVWRVQDKVPDATHQQLVALVKAAAPIMQSLDNMLLRFDDAEAAAILRADDAVDDAYKDMVIEAPSALIATGLDGDAVSDILFIAKNIERLADHATDVIREMYYVHHGERMVLS